MWGTNGSEEDKEKGVTSEENRLGGGKRTTDAADGRCEESQHADGRAKAQEMDEQTGNEGRKKEDDIMRWK